jgi:hypothetical protein
VKLNQEGHVDIPMVLVCFAIAILVVALDKVLFG